MQFSFDDNDLSPLPKMNPHREEVPLINATRHESMSLTIISNITAGRRPEEPAQGHHRLRITDSVDVIVGGACQRVRQHGVSVVTDGRFSPIRFATVAAPRCGTSHRAAATATRTADQGRVEAVPPRHRRLGAFLRCMHSSEAGEAERSPPVLQRVLAFFWGTSLGHRDRTYRYRCAQQEVEAPASPVDTAA